MFGGPIWIAAATLPAGGKISSPHGQGLSGRILPELEFRAAFVARTRKAVTQMSTSAVATTPLTELPSWKALEAHYHEVAPKHLRELFAADPSRGTKFTAEALGIYLDFSKHRITDETLKLLLELAERNPG